MKKLRIILSTLIVLTALAVPVTQTGCKSTLESGGAYAPTNSVGVVVADKPFLVVESAFSLAYSTIHNVFEFEKENRTTLWALSPEIKHTLDRLRPQALSVRNEYIKYRTMYQAAATPDNLSKLRASVTKLETLSTQAKDALPK